MIEFPFDESIAENCSLLLNVQPNRFSYAVTDADSRMKALFEMKKVGLTLDDVEEVIVSDDLLKMKYAQTKVSLFSDSYTFIPNDLYQEESISNYARLLQPTAGDAIVVSSMTNARCKNVFAISEDNYKWFSGHFSNLSYYTQADSFVQSVIAQYGLSGETAMFLNVYSDTRIEIMVLHLGVFTHYNVFEYEAVEDVLYYALAVSEQLGLMPQTLPINLSGDIEPQSPISQILFPYFNRVQLIASVTFLDVPLTFSTVAMQKFFSTLGLNLCAS